MHTRKSYLCWPFQYSIYAVSTQPDNTGLPPICVADKPKRPKRAQNVFVDDCRFPDKIKHYKALLCNVEGGIILQKLKHPAPPLDKVDALFFCTYNKANHGEQMQRDLDLSHLKPQVRDRVNTLVKKYWPVFEKNGVFTPVKHYECVIDNGDSLPIAIKKILYGPKETPIMRRAITALEKCQTDIPNH
jgi:hypothetical protein